MLKLQDAGCSSQITVYFVPKGVHMQRRPSTEEEFAGYVLQPAT